MPQIIVTAAVNDVDEWLKFKAEMVPAMSAVASDGASYVAMDGSNQVASTWDVPDMEAFPGSPELLLSGTGGGGEASRDDPIDDGGVHQEVGRRSLRGRRGSLSRIERGGGSDGRRSSATGEHWYTKGFAFDHAEQKHRACGDTQQSNTG
jgi:hypothetical protein